MAVVGEAHILVRAITTGVNRDIQRAFRGLSGEGGSARRSGESLGAAFSRGFNSNVNGNIFSKITQGLNTMAPAAEGARRRFQSLVRTGYTLGTAVSVVIGGISSLISGLFSLVGAGAAAATSLVGVVGALVSLRIGAFAASFALKGISGAVSQATNAQSNMGQTLAEVNKQFKELRRSAESAAMSEKRAGLELEKARNNLLRMQDLPPNNMARREAELALEEAELNYRQAKERSTDLNDELSKGKKGLMATASVDPYAGLTKSQREFAKLLVDLKPKLDELREAVAEGFLPLLGEQLERLANGPFFDTIKTGLAGIGDSLGIAAKNFTDFLVSQINLDKLETVFANAKPTIEDFGTILGKAFDGFLSVLVFADPLVKQFVAFLDRNLGKFANFMNAPENKSEIEGFFATVSVLAKDFAEIFGNLFGGFGNVIKANIGAGSGGQILIDYLKKITASFKNLQTIDGKSLRDFFAGAAENAKSVLGSVGALLGEIFKLADNPAIGETFDILKKGAAPLGEILGKYIEAGPAFANLVVTLTEITNKLTDTEAIKIFFDTLNAIATVVNNALGNETLQKILAITGQVFAFVSAIGLAITTAKFFGNVVVGAVGSVTGPIGNAITMFSKFRTNALINSRAMVAFGNGFQQTLGKMGKFLLSSPVLIAIGILVAAFAYLYATSDEFRLFIDTTMKSVLEGLGDAFTRIWEAIQPLVDVLINQVIPILAETLRPIIELLVVSVGSLVIFLAQFLAGAFEKVMPFIKGFLDVFTLVINVVGGVITIIGELIKALFTGEWTRFGEVFKGIINRIIAGIVKLFEGAVNMVIDGINSLMHSFFNGIGGGLADAIKAFSGGTINLKAPNLIKKVRFTPVQLGEGGTVFPRPGGTFAQIAEAGRPERVEPLDPDGLSNRDKAIIRELSGGANGTTINVYPSAGMDERELANMVSRKLAFEIRKGAF